MDDKTECRKVVVDYLKKYPLCVLSTTDGKEAHGAAVYVLLVEEDTNPTVFLFTHEDSKKANNTRNFPGVSITSFDEKDATTLQMAGKAEGIKDFKQEQAYIKRLLDAAHSRLTNWVPVHMLKDGAIKVFKVRLEHVKFSDFSKGDVAQIQIFNLTEKK